MANSNNVYGQIFSKDEADGMFGPVLTSIPISTLELNGLLNSTTNNIMFKIIDNDLIIVDNERNILFLQGTHEINNTTVFSLFSISVIRELIEEGQSDITETEQRQNVLSLTNGNFTMEVGALCPPVCN